MGVVTLLAAAYIAVLLRGQIVDDVRRLADGAADLAPGEAELLPSLPLEP
jgi:hypothetical protein